MGCWMPFGDGLGDFPIPVCRLSQHYYQNGPDMAAITECQKRIAKLYETITSFVRGLQFGFLCCWSNASVVGMLE